VDSETINFRDDILLFDVNFDMNSRLPKRGRCALKGVYFLAAHIAELS